MKVVPLRLIVLALISLFAPAVAQNLILDFPQIGVGGYVVNKYQSLASRC